MPILDDAPTECMWLQEGKDTCFDLFNCCSCGGHDCGCPYCFDCKACDYCLEQDD